MVLQARTVQELNGLVEELRENTLGVGDVAGLVLGDVEVNAHEHALTRDIHIGDALLVEVLQARESASDVSLRRWRIREQARGGELTGAASAWFTD